MSKILFIYPKLEPYKDYSYMPLSALAVCSKLLIEGHEVTIWDDRVDKVKEKSLGQLVNNADEIMISIFTGFQLSEAYTIMEIIKKCLPEKKIILGGPHATALAHQTLSNPLVDEVFVGNYEDGKEPLPFHLIDHTKYINPETERFIYVSSYGCIGRCTFCDTVHHRKLVFKPLEVVEKDINTLMDLYAYKECVFFDATLFTVPERALYIANLMKQHNLQWICDSRADEICKAYRHLKLDNIIIDSGLKQITIGLESGSPKVVENMQKGKTHLEDFKRCASILKDYPVKMVSGVVFGTPGETVNDLQLTIDYIKQIQEINPNFRISTTFFKPLPGTVMCVMAEQFGYKMPESLSKWAEQGEKSHYNYNEWEDVPWIYQIDNYRKLYETFKKENKELFV